ncbi:receptor-type tyrosine-protein phosphatase S-like isoform X2 [Patiria miniata]|uniref:protein-tyrosine-phosphatase n=1 Tax=Patiria miniata TaxID=46514 RepID=A0A913ZYG8_PATMI|nr:receptor-type tyrosine-protein phosphatase S-like isoform X2 [Patiria miniata]
MSLRQRDSLSSNCLLICALVTLVWMSDLCVAVQPPVITRELQSEFGIEGGVIVFVCQASGDPEPSFRWEKGSRNAQNTRSEIFPMPSGSVLRIEPLRDGRDDAEFHCIASNIAGTARSTARLQVYTSTRIPAGFPVITRDPVLDVVEKGFPILLHCEAEGNPDPEIIWFKEYIPVDLSTERVKLTSSGLSISVSEFSDRGKYQCAARNSAGIRFSKTALLYVRVRRVAPRFTIFPETQEVVPGGNVNLTCAANGSPMPVIKWMKGDEDLSGPDDTLPQGRSVLVLKNVQETAEYTCYAMSDLGEIEHTVTVTVRTRPDSPPVPTLSQHTANTVTVQWIAGTDEPIKTYVLKYEPSSSPGAAKEIAGITVTEYTIDDLLPFTEYNVRVAAVNTIGRGDFSRALTVTTAQLAPSTAPREVRASPLSASTILVQWTAPETPNGIVRGYNIYYSNTPSQNLSFWYKHSVEDGTQRLTTISDLNPDQIYSIRASAFTAIGEGPASNAVQVITKQGVPSQPEMFVGEAISATQIRLTWRQRETEAQILYYELYYNDSKTGNDEHRSIPKAETYTLEDLKPNTVYNIRLAAKSRAGQGASTPIVSVRTEQAVPGAPPQDVKATTLSSTSLRIEWEPPPQDRQNGDVTGYKVSYVKVPRSGEVDTQDEMLLAVGPNDRSCVLVNLDKWTIYQITVLASTKIGDGPASRPISAETDEDVPEGPPRKVSVEALNSTTIAVRWSPPVLDRQHGEIRGYQVHFQVVSADEDPLGPPQVKWVPLPDIREKILENLSPKTYYSIEIAAYTIKGDGERSRPKLVQTPGQVPGQPKRFVVERIESGDYHAHWERPDDTHGDLLMYKLSYQTSTSRPLYREIRPPATEFYPITLNKGQRYIFTLAAKNSEGYGLQAETDVITPEGKPTGAPQNFTGRALTSTSIQLSWSKPSDEESNGVITLYSILYYLEKEPGQEFTNDTVNTQVTFTNLKPSTQYVFKVRAHTGVGSGPYGTEVILVTPHPAPREAPRYVHAKPVSTTSILVEWKPPLDIDSSRPGLTYIVYYTSGSVDSNLDSWQRRVVGNFHSEEISGLEPKTVYAIVVQLQTPEGNSPRSYVERATTLKEESTAPDRFQAELKDGNSVKLVWDTPSSTDGSTTGYRIVYATSPQGQKEHPDHVDEGQSVTLTNEHRTFHISALKPNMEYQFNITAVTETGSSPPATVLVHTRRAAPNHVPIPEVDMALTTATTLTITIPPLDSRNGQIDNVLIVVVPLDGPSLPTGSPSDYSMEELLSSSGHRNQRDTSLRKRRATSNSLPYITAYLLASELTVPFTIGDEHYINGFHNRPLEENRYYTFFIKARVLSEDEELLVASSDYSHPVQVKKRISTAPGGNNGTPEPNRSNPSKEPSDSSSMPAIIGAVIGVIILLVIIVIIIIFLRNKRRSGPTERRPKRKEVKSTNPSDPVEMRRMNYQTPAMMSHPPIPVMELSDHIEHLKSNENLLFSQEYESIEPGQQFTWDHSNLEVNKPKNRYANVIAYDHSRVILSRVDGLPGSDYLNANYCDGYRKQNAYIATQGPLPETLGDFWRMVWEQRTCTLVMMTKLEERNRVKCDQYWPSKGHETYGDIQVTLHDMTDLATYSVRNFSLINIKKPAEKREVRQFQFTAWPDHGVPEHATQVLAFVSRIKACNPPDAGPIVVHCSAGVGRTGAFIVIDSMLERIKHEKTVDIYGHVTCLRAQRNYMVQTEEQYIFIHEALLEAVLSGNTEVPARNLYSHIQKLTQTEPGETITGMESEFKRLANQKALPSKFVSANLPANKFKNRLVNILPYESTRVCLQPIRGVEGSDYINASHIDGYKQKSSYVATQGPLAETTEDFWRMLWEQNSTIIVMLTKLREMGREKCHQYWPAERSARYQYFVVDPMSEYNMPQYILREFKVTDARDGQSRTIRQFQFTDWPDQGVPKSGEGFIDFIGQVHKTKEQFGQDGPITVHCSAGVGRTGVFVTLSIVLERMRFESVVDMYQTVKILRTQRPAMVQTEDQYQFCYRAAFEYLGSFDHFT